MKPILEVRDLSKRYANHTALNNISIEVPQGSIFGLLGPNGAGKTTLIRIINQIALPDTGEVLFSGDKLHGFHRKHIGYLPEERGLYRKMKVGEQCLYLAQLKGLHFKDAKEKLIFWFEKFDIIHWWNIKIEELSKGMAQKIQFIVTVIHEPTLLILDEPFSGLDPINTQLIKDEIIRINQNGTTILLSTHDMPSVEELCQDITLLNQSQNILSGRLKDIKNKFKTHQYRIDFKGDLDKFNIALSNGSNHQKPEWIDDNTYTTVLQLASDISPNHTLSQLIPYVEVTGVREILPSMSDLFIQAVSAHTH